MLRPNFFIVGAPKCGTTAMANYLSAHPEIFMAHPKEPHFFGSDLRPPHDEYVRDRKRYLDLFTGAGKVPWVGEASVLYLMSAKAPEEIKSFSPDARIVIMVRRPTDLIESLYVHTVYGANEDLDSLSDALAAEADRLEGKRLPKRLRFSADVLQYRRVARLASQVDRYSTIFGRDKIHVVLFDDFQNDARNAYAGVCRFLDVEPLDQQQFPVVNASKRSQNLRAYRTLYGLGKARALGRLFPQGFKERIAASLRGIPVLSGHIQGLTVELELLLLEEFRDEIDQLAEFIDRDLSSWHRPRIEQRAQ